MTPIPTAHTLTASQMQTLKTLLLARRQDMTARMAQSRADLQPAENTAGSVSQDENLRLANQRREIGTALTALEAQELARIDRALDDMENGNYGRCDECGCAIPFERLEVEPMTRHCVQCKSGREQAKSP